MAIGDDALAAGFALVNGGTGLVKDGDDEINKTRDYIAQVKNLIKSVWGIADGGTGATTAAGARTNLGISGAITTSPYAPTGGNPGDIHFQYTP